RRLLLALGLAVGLPAAAQAPKAAAYTPPDGHWWLSASSEERDGFLIGYFECYSFMLRKEVPSGRPGGGLLQAVTDTYDNGSESAPVSSVIQLLFDRWRKGHRYRFVRADPANEYDGEWWRQAGDEDHAREGIIAGFLACQSAEQHLEVKTPVAVLVARVSRWYGVDPRDDSVISEKTDNDKLGAVIVRAEKEPPQ